jgi:hypothetical protein
MQQLNFKWRSSNGCDKRLGEHPVASRATVAAFGHPADHGQTKRSRAMSDDDGFDVSGSAAFAGEDSVALLTTAWLNEKMAPEILLFEADLVAAVQERLEAQLERLAEIRRLDSRQELIANIMQLEVDRVRYVITSYYRTRLQKVRLCALEFAECRFTLPVLDGEACCSHSQVRG